MNADWMCDVTCGGCGATFHRHAMSNALAPDARYCEVCWTAKKYIESLNPPQPLRYVTYSPRFSRFLALLLRSPRHAIIAAWVWYSMIHDTYGVEVEERRIKLHPLWHINLSDADVTL